MEANLVDLVAAQNTKTIDNFENQIVENGQHATIEENEKSYVKLKDIEDVKLDTVQVEVPNIRTCENELNTTDSASPYMLNDTFTHEAATNSYNSLRITPSKTEAAADDVITILDDSSVIMVLDESHKENSMLETQSIDPSKNLNKTYPEEKSFQDSKTNISTSDVQEKDSNKSSKDIEGSVINTIQDESCVEILDNDNKKRDSLNQTSSVFESSQHLEESRISTTRNESCVEILDIDNEQKTSLNHTSSVFQASQNSEEALISPVENESRVIILDDDNKKRTSINQNSSAFEFSLRLEESLINTTQNSCVEILDNDNKKRASLNQTSTSALESSHSEYPEESLVNTAQNESVEILDNDIKKRASLNQTSATFESSQHLEESLVNTTQNKSCVEILDNDNKKRTSFNQTSTSAFESSHSEYPEESLINTAQNEFVEILDNDIKKRASLNQKSATFESSQHLEESLVNTTQNKSCAEILDNDNKKRTTFNQTSTSAFESSHSQYLEESHISSAQKESCEEILDNDKNRKRNSLNKASSAFESIQHLDESLTNTMQNESCVHILDNDNKKGASLNPTSTAFETSQHLEESLVNTTQILDNDNKKRTSLNQTSSSASESHSQHLEESYVDILDNNNRKRISLNKTPSAFESSQQPTTNDLIDLNETCSEERNSDKVVPDVQGSMILLEEFTKKDSTTEIDKCLVNNSCCKIIHDQPNESVDSDNNKIINVNETLPVLDSSHKTSTNGSIDGSNDLNAYGEKLQNVNQNETYTTYEEEIESKLDASESTNLLNQTFSEDSVKYNRNSALNSTETDLVMALEALNINCDEKDETFLSCQDAFEESVREEVFESIQNATTNNTDSSVHNFNTTFQSGEKNYTTSIDDEICDPENAKTEEDHSRSADEDKISPSNENDNCMSRASLVVKEDSVSCLTTIQVSSPRSNINENDNSMRNEAISVDDSSEVNKNSSSETVIQDDNELDLATVPDDVISPKKSVPKPRLSDVSNDDTLIDYNSLLEASPSVFDRRASMFLRQSDLKLYVNDLEQKIATLHIELCKKERIIIKQQMQQNCPEKYRQFEENNGLSESKLIKKLSLELEEEKRKIAEMKTAHKRDVNTLNEKLSAQEEKYKELEQNNTEIVSKLEKETSDKKKLNELLDKAESFMNYMSTRNKELVEEKASLEKQLHNINAAFKEVVGKYEQCKVIIIGLKKNEEIYKRENDELRHVLRRHDETYAALKKDAETKLKEASEQIKTLQQERRDEERAKRLGKRFHN